VRTTLTLDDDVAAILKRLARSRRARMKDLVNVALRRGLAQTEAMPQPREPFRTASVSLGRSRLGAIDSVADALAAAEGR